MDPGTCKLYGQFIVAGLFLGLVSTLPRDVSAVVAGLLATMMAAVPVGVAIQKPDLLWNNSNGGPKQIGPVLGMIIGMSITATVGSLRCVRALFV